MKKRFGFIFILALCLSPLILSSCSTNNKTYSTIEEINGNPVACVDGSPSFQNYLKKVVPDSKVSFYKTYADCEYSVECGKTAAMICDGTALGSMRWNEGKRIKRIEEPVATSDYGFMFRKEAKSDELRLKINEYIYNNQERLKVFQHKWIADGNSTKGAKREDIVVYPDSEKQGEFTAFIVDINPPFGFNENGVAQGYDVDVLIDFAKQYKYNIDISPYSNSSICEALETKKCDLIAGGFNVTTERKETYNFSIPNYVGDVVLAVFDPTVPPTSNPFVEGFYKTFIEENRWQSYVNGTLTTLFITLVSAIVGTFIGYGLYILGLNNKVAKKIINALTIFFTRTPIAVILMIFYYIIFSTSGIGAVFVSVITFTIAFSLTMNGLITHGVNAIDRNQFESMYALGYTRTRGFNRVILPQAIRNFAASYSDEIVSLIKSTSVVGFISVVDLTKATDLIRSASFQTFVPLITSAIIYFLLATLLIVLVRFIDKKINPYHKQKSKMKREDKKCLK